MPGLQPKHVFTAVPIRAEPRQQAIRCPSGSGVMPHRDTVCAGTRRKASPNTSENGGDHHEYAALGNNASFPQQFKVLVCREAFLSCTGVYQTHAALASESPRGTSPRRCCHTRGCSQAPLSVSTSTCSGVVASIMLVDSAAMWLSRGED